MRQSGDPIKLEALDRELEALGGRKAYQDASKLATSAFKTSRHVFALLTSLGLRPTKGQPPLQALEVGAINTNLHGQPWLNVRGIDLLSRHPKIEQIDFFALVPSGHYDVLVNSMGTSRYKIRDRK